MDSFMEMGTTARHNEIITALLRKILNFVDGGESKLFHENYSLVYWGKRTELDSLELVDIKNIKDTEHFKENVMNELRRIEPDFMLFDKNGYIENKKRTRIAGFPDLVIEVWSEGNSEAEQELKKFLYSTSPATEHWYIEQDSNDVECFMGDEVLPRQSLKDILLTQNGVEFDLRHMAI